MNRQPGRHTEPCHLQVFRRCSRPDARLSAWSRPAVSTPRDAMGLMRPGLEGLVYWIVSVPALSFEVRSRGTRRLTDIQRGLNARGNGWRDAQGCPCDWMGADTAITTRAGPLRDHCNCAMNRSGTCVSQGNRMLIGMVSPGDGSAYRKAETRRRTGKTRRLGTSRLCLHGPDETGDLCSKTCQTTMQWLRSRPGSSRPMFHRIEHGGDRTGRWRPIRRLRPVPSHASRHGADAEDGWQTEFAVRAIFVHRQQRQQTCNSNRQGESGRGLYTSGSTKCIWRRQPWEHL